MNCRTMFKAAIGACAALLLPWRKVQAGEDQVERIKRLIVKRSRWPNSAIWQTGIAYRATVHRRQNDPRIVEIWWDEESGKAIDGRWNVGLVALTEDLAASLSDGALTPHLLYAFLKAVSNRYSHRVALLERFEGSTICITRRKRQGIVIEPAIYTQCAMIRGDLNTFGGLSKTS